MRYIYLVFAYYDYYPEGGISDLFGAYDNLEDANNVAIKLSKEYDNVEIFDSRELEVIYYYYLGEKQTENPNYHNLKNRKFE